MDDERWEPGMPVLDRQAARPATVPATSQAAARETASAPPMAPTLTRGTASPLPPSLAGLPPRSVPEVAPTPLQRHYINLSVVVLICGAIAITALELGTPLGSPLIKLCFLIGAPLLVVTTADALVRIWRSAWAWMPVDPGKGWFRLAWVGVSAIGLGALVVAAIVVLTA